MAHDIETMTVEERRAELKRLRSEESAVSFWRRIIQGSIDGRQAAQQGVSASEVVTTIVGHQDTVSRQSYFPVGDVPPPPIPGLQELWERHGDNLDDPSIDLVLADAEKTLSARRHELHEHIDGLAASLVAAYHADPTLVLQRFESH